MKNILFYTSRNVTGNFSTGLVCNLKLLETQGDRITHLTAKKTDAGTKFIRQYNNMRIHEWVNLYGDFYVNEVKGMADWEEVYEKIDVSHFEKYDALYIMGGLHFPQQGLYRFSKIVGQFPIADKTALTFGQSAVHITNVLAIHKAHVTYDIPLHEFSYDCDEMATSLFALPQNPDKYRIYHLYEMAGYGMQRLDCLQYHYQETEIARLFEPEKVYDMTFGYTIYSNGNRPSYQQWVDDKFKQFDKTNKYVKNVVTGEENTVSRDTYLEKILESRYTLIVPSYDNTCFSMYRFVESIQNECLPIIHPDCAIDEVSECYGLDFSRLVELQDFSEENRLEQLEYFSKVLKFEKGFDDA